MKKLIVITDWASDSLSCQEFRSSLEGFLKKGEYPNLNFVISSPSTIHTAFITSQVVQTEERYGLPLKTVIFINVDPRLSSKGAEFILVKLKSGIYLCGPNAGYDFSLIKEKIDEAFIYKDVNIASQFRSRDVYARVCAHLMEEMEDELELEEISTIVIPDLVGFYVGHIDNFGNIKTTIPLSYLKGKYEYGESIAVEINRVRRKARFVKGLFGGEVGELVIYPGSSGKKDDPFLEISVWRHFIEDDRSTGALLFKNPLPGEKIYLPYK